MSQVQGFNDLVDAVVRLSPEDQEALVDIVRRRLVEQRRRDIAVDIEASRKEFAAGHCPPTTPDQLMNEILS